VQLDTASVASDTRTEPTPRHPGSELRSRHQMLTIALHWLTVLLVVVQFTLALLHAQASDADLRRDMLAAHRSLGVMIALVIIVRLGWRIFGMQLPPFPADMSRWHQWGARLSEWGLYGLLLAQPATGLVSIVLKGRPFTLLGFVVPPLMTPDKYWAAIGGLHLLGGYALATLVLVHAGAALLHRFVANDGVLDSMLPSRREKANQHPV
jgi:superoxide oxidase